MRVSDVLRSKAAARGASVVTVSPDAPVADLVHLLATHGIGCLVVSRDGREVVGMVSERDVVRRLNEGRTVTGHQVAAIMSTDLHTCSPDDSVTDLMRVMTDHRVRHVPVLVDGELVGIVSIGDVVKHRIEQLEFERDQLEGYVHGP